ncbi:MAG: cytochrome c3 family protein [Blastocatellia bacterium]|jgi:hypothetical protein
MAQIFHHSANTLARTSILVGVLGVASVLGVMVMFFNSAAATGVGEIREQPVPFSHAHHVGGEGIDCRYCHVSVDKEASAGMPSTKTCMTCHSQIWKDSPLLEPVRASLKSDQSLQWIRVHDLSDFAYFNHAIHVNKGVGCSTCHGRLDQMQLTFKTQSLYMQWCINCHKNPEKVLRPLDKVYDLTWEPPLNQDEVGARLAKEYNIPNRSLLTSCSTCHR